MTESIQFTEVVTEGYELSAPRDIGHGVRIWFVRDRGVIDCIFWDHGCQWGRTPVQLDVPENAHVPAEGKWQVDSLEPLTISPSLLCPCGRHGFIRDGRWVPC